MKRQMSKSDLALLKSRLGLHFKQAELQFARVIEARSRMSGPDWRTRDAAAETLLPQLVSSEVHLLAVSLRCVRRLALTLSQSSNCAVDLNDDLGELCDSLGPYDQLRNFFEHFDERIPSGPRSNSVRGLQNPGCGVRVPYVRMTGHFYGYGDVLVDCGPDAAQKFCTLADRILKKLNNADAV